MAKVPISVAYGDGIGPEIMEAALNILQEAGAELEIETIELGEKVHARGVAAGIEPAAWESLHRTKVLFKAPLSVPPEAAATDPTMTLRRALGLYANVRPCLSYHPYVDTKFPRMDLVVIRENEEDVYAGIEYRQTTDVAQCLRLISRPGSERIIRYAFEYAQAQGRKKLSCFTNHEVMKMTDGLFHQVFDEIGAHYPEIEKEHWLVDIGAAKLADTPERFDVIVLPNLYGDILSDITAQIAGSVGLAGSANIGDAYGMFEAIHGSATRRTGQNLANPSGLFLGGVLMLVHLGQTEAAARAHNAWLKTIEDGIHTYDIFKEGISKQKVGTKEFAKAVVERLGQAPLKLKPVSYKPETAATLPEYHRPAEVKQLVGVDVFVAFESGLDDLAKSLQLLEGDGLKLEVLANRGLAVWPDAQPETFRTDTFCARFKLPEDTTAALPPGAIVSLLDRTARANIEFLKIELLYNFDGKPGFSKYSSAI
jgi:isocitrate dehydrogenase